MPRLVSSRHKAAGDDDEPSGSHYYLRHLQAAEEPPVRDPIGEGTADAWVERSPSLLRLTGRDPFNGEPPLPLLMRHGFVTPARCTTCATTAPCRGRTGRPGPSR